MIIIEFFKYILWCVNNRKKLEDVKKIFDKGGRKCDDCGREHEMFSIVDTLWLKYCDEKDYICMNYPTASSGVST